MSKKYDKIKGAEAPCSIGQFQPSLYFVDSAVYSVKASLEGCVIVVHSGNAALYGIDALFQGLHFLPHFLPEISKLVSQPFKVLDNQVVYVAHGQSSFTRSLAFSKSKTKFSGPALLAIGVLNFCRHCSNQAQAAAFTGSNTSSTVPATSQKSSQSWRALNSADLMYPRLNLIAASKASDFTFQGRLEALPGPCQQFYRWHARRARNREWSGPGLIRDYAAHAAPEFRGRGFMGGFRPHAVRLVAPGRPRREDMGTGPVLLVQRIG
jgi:hypothetical protein